MMQVFVSTRSEGNMAYNWGKDSQEVWENRQRFAKRCGFSVNELVVPSILGGDDVLMFTEADRGRCRPGQADLPEGDIFLVGTPGLFVGILLGDCMGGFIFDPVKQVYAGFHCGWRGVMQMAIPGKTVAALQETFACNPSDLQVVIPPYLQAESSFFSEIHDIFTRPGYEKYVTKTSEGFLADWGQRVVDDLVAAGVRPENIERSREDTFTSNQYFSHRQAKQGLTSEARFLVVFGLPT